MPATPTIFVSHSHLDNDWCRPFYETLRASGLNVWYDEKGLAAGAAFVKVIQDELQARDIFLLALTPNAWASEWVQEEIQLALATRRRIIVVEHLPTQVNGFLLTRQWVKIAGLDAQAAAQQVANEIIYENRSGQPLPVSRSGRPIVSQNRLQTPLSLADLLRQRTNVLNFLWRQHTTMGWRILHFLVDVFGAISYIVFSLGWIEILAQATPSSGQTTYMVLNYAIPLILFGFLALNIALTHFYAFWNEENILASLLRWFLLLPVLICFGFVFLIGLALWTSWF